MWMCDHGFLHTEDQPAQTEDQLIRLPNKQSRIHVGIETIARRHGRSSMEDPMAAILLSQDARSRAAKARRQGHHTIKRSQVSLAASNRALLLPKESEMLPRDKYTTFNKTSKGYRKSVNKVPTWTRLTLRENPKGF